MGALETTSKLSAEDLREEVRKEYADVALDPHKGYHFHTGRAAAERLGYDSALYVNVPDDNLASFAGTGNPFKLGPINPGEIVVDIGSGSGFDALIASTLVGPEGKVITARAGDVIIVPAGVSHKNVNQSPDFRVVGAYPRGQMWDMNYGKTAERPGADENIKNVPLPATDPVFGKTGLLMRLWN